MPSRPTLAVLLVFLFAALAASALFAGEEPFGQNLTRPDSLAGWDHGDAPPAGWTIRQGRLHGEKGAKPLLSGYTFGPVELRLRWSVGPDGVVAIDLPEVPRGRGLRLVLRENGPRGTLTDGDKILHPGETLDTTSGAMGGLTQHTAVILRSADTLTVSIDGRRLYSVAMPSERRFGLGITLLDGEATLSDLRAAEPIGQPVFNEKDLSEWWTTGKLSAWRVERGELVLVPGGGQFLRTKKEYENFTLSFEYKVRARGNSGMALRVPRLGWPSGDGMELQILDRPWTDQRPNEHDQMSLYGNVLPLARADRSSQWNRVVVKTDGWMVSAWVNGELVQQFNTLHHPELKHRGRRGWIGPQDHGAWIRLREMRILASPSGLGLDVWSTPKPPTAAMTIVDRLMNPETLARRDGVASTVVSRTFRENQSGETVLADLAGPGAVVQVSRVGAAKRIAFYFDGEKKPRIECPPGELSRFVTPLSDDAWPLLTYLPYKKSLRIVADSPRKGVWRIDTVAFPADLPVETFRDPWTALPRGWWGTTRYRQLVVHWGVHREHDPTPRIAPPKKTIPPGATETLAQADGAGVVRWVKLRADQKTLENNDLWLSATVDGEAEPALSAPARFWFPGLIDGKNYYNFVLVRRDGMANMLAMPFGRGITISATNHGDRPIHDVGVELSVQRATEANRREIAALGRLRGVFLPAGNGTDTLFELSGSGRWVGLVVAPGESDLPKIGSLVMDGQAAPGWVDQSFEAFLGQQGKDFRRCLSGCRGGLAWRYLLLAPVDFHRSLVWKADGKALPDRLALYYQEPKP